MAASKTRNRPLVLAEEIGRKIPTSGAGWHLCASNIQKAVPYGRKSEQPNNRFLRLYEELFSTFFLFIHNIFIRTRTFFQLQLEESSLNWPWNKAKPIFKFCQKFWRLRCWYSQKQGQNPSKLRQTAYSRKHITPKLTNLSTQTIIFETFRCLWSIYLDKFGLDSQSCIFKFILKSSLKVCGVSIIKKACRTSVCISRFHVQNAILYISYFIWVYWQR